MESKDHSEHVVSLGYSLFVFISLLILTGITVFSAKKVDLGYFNFTFALIIASLKAGLIVAIFMGLKWDRTKINLMIFFAALLFVFFFLSIILFDYQFRGAIDKVENTYDLEMGYAPAVKGVEQRSKTEPRFISFQYLAELKQQMMMGKLPKELLKAQESSKKSDDSLPQQESKNLE